MMVVALPMYKVLCLTTTKLFVVKYTFYLIGWQRLCIGRLNCRRWCLLTPTEVVLSMLLEILNVDDRMRLDVFGKVCQE